MAEARPVAVSARTLLRCCWRWRTVSATGLEDAGERAADLALHVDRGRDVEQVVGSESLAHRDERLLERTAEPRLGEHAPQLGADRRCALVRDSLERRLEPVTDAQRAGDRAEHVRQLRLERVDATCRRCREARRTARSDPRRTAATSTTRRRRVPVPSGEDRRARSRARRRRRRRSRPRQVSAAVSTSRSTRSKRRRPRSRESSAAKKPCDRRALPLAFLHVPPRRVGVGAHEPLDLGGARQRLGAADGEEDERPDGEQEEQDAAAPVERAPREPAATGQRRSSRERRRTLRARSCSPSVDLDLCRPVAPRSCTRSARCG